MIFYFLFAFYYILCVKFLQNCQAMVTSYAVGLVGESPRVPVAEATATFGEK